MINRDRDKHRTPTVLCVGADESANGGIATVLHAYLRAYSSASYNFDFKLLRTSYYKDKPRYWEPFIFGRAICMFIFLIAFKKVKVIHIHASHGFSFARKTIFVFLARLFGKRVIFHIHSSRFYTFYLSDHWLVFRCVKKVLEMSDMVVVLCRDWERRLKERLPHVTITALPNPSPVECDAYIERPANDKLIVVFLGFLIPSKGIYDLLTVADMIAERKLNNIKIVIAGKGELEGVITDRIEKSRPSSIVEFKGWVAGKTKKELLMSSDVLFLPSYNEGMPMVILEAMRYSLPIVSTRIAGIPELLVEAENGFLFEPGDTEGFFEALQTLSANRNLAKRLGRRSYELSERFKGPVVFRKLLDLYNLVCSEDVFGVEEGHVVPIHSNEST
jgi:glycosyltransferase involved in cell wall biosynthesis